MLIALAGGALPAPAGADDVSDAVATLRAAVQERLGPLTQPGATPEQRKAAHRLTQVSDLLGRTSGDPGSDARLLAKAMKLLVAAVPIHTDVALEALRDIAIDRLLTVGGDRRRAAEALAGNVPTARGKKRTAALVARGRKSFDVALARRKVNDLAGGLRQTARGFQLYARAIALARKLGATVPLAEGSLTWLKANVFGPSCALPACHSAEVAQGNLVLAGDRPFGELVGALASNPAAAAEKVRVKAGDPDASFLYRKLIGALSPAEGEAMPRTGARLLPETIAQVRRWIEGGALPDGREDITLPVPAAGFQIRIPPFDVPPGTEGRRNYYFKTSNTEPVAATRIEFLSPPGSHHFDVFTADVVDQLDGAFEETFADLLIEAWSMRASSQRQHLDWTLPPGVGILFQPRQQLLGQIHFANTGLQLSPIGGVGVLNVHTKPLGQVQNLLGTLFGQNKGIFLPPHQESTFDFGTTLVQLGVDHPVHVCAVTGHFHWRGKSFEVRRWDGLHKDPRGFPAEGEFDRMGPGETIFRSDDWDEPPFRIFPNAEVELSAGWGIVYRTVFFNDTDQAIPFGPRVATQEHADIYLYFYPAPADGHTLRFPLSTQQ